MKSANNRLSSPPRARLFRDLAAGVRIGPEDVRSLRPAADLGPDAIGDVIGRSVKDAVRRGDPVALTLLT